MVRKSPVASASIIYDVMNLETFKSTLTIGETIAMEFKRCGNGIEHDTFETVCAFLNQFGGDIFRIIVPLDDEPTEEKY